MSRFAVAVLVVLLLGFGPWACERESSPPSSEKEQPAPATSAATPVPAATTASAAAEEDEDALVLFAEGEPEEGKAPLTVRFTVESLLEGEMKEPKYTWDFGDGSPPSNEAGPTHTYTKPGVYTVTVRVIDAEGEKGWDEIEVEVAGADNPESGR